MKSIRHTKSTKASTFNNQSSLLMKRRRALPQRISIPNFDNNLDIFAY